MKHQYSSPTFQPSHWSVPHASGSTSQPPPPDGFRPNRRQTAEPEPTPPQDHTTSTYSRQSNFVEQLTVAEKNKILLQYFPPHSKVLENAGGGPCLYISAAQSIRNADWRALRRLAHDMLVTNHRWWNTFSQFIQPIIENGVDISLGRARGDERRHFNDVDEYKVYTIEVGWVVIGSVLSVA